MPELRWILLIVGVLFLAGLAFWEARRKRRLPADEPTRRISDTASASFREPVLTLPEMRARDASTAQELPVVELGRPVRDPPARDLRIEPHIAAADIPPGDAIDPAKRHPEAVTPQSAIGEDGAKSQDNETQQRNDCAEPVVEWPPEEQRQLIALRLIAPPGERFPGRALRLALSAEGFVLGKFSIFHKPGPDLRVTVSVASLTRPGSFDSQTMDSQRYGGVGFFSVLPGPLSAREMFDALLSAARDLRDRLQGTLQDERGEPLTAERIAQWRDSLSAETAEPLQAQAPPAATPAPEPPQ